MRKVWLGVEAVRQIRNLIVEDRQRVRYEVDRNSRPAVSVGCMAYIAKTPAGGIAAMSGTTPGSAECDLYRLSDGGTLEVHTNDSGDTVTVTVYNIATSAVAGSTFIQCKKEAITGLLLADFEDCT